MRLGYSGQACVCLLFLSVLVSVSCWLSKNNLDAFLSPSLCVLEHFKQLQNHLGVKTFKEFTSETIRAGYFCGRLVLLKVFSSKGSFAFGAGGFFSYFVSFFPSTKSFFKLCKIPQGLPWWLGGKESACQRKSRRFEP